MVKNNIIFFSLLPLKLGINTEKKNAKYLFSKYLYLILIFMYALDIPFERKTLKI